MWPWFSLSTDTPYRQGSTMEHSQDPLSERENLGRRSHPLLKKHI